MKLLNLTAALFLGGVLQAQNPLPAIHPQPQEVTLSTNRLKAPHGFTLSGMQHPDEDAMRLIRQTLSITDNSEALPLKITSLEDRTPELKRSGAYLLVITPEEIDIAISDSRGLFYAAQTGSDAACHGIFQRYFTFNIVSFGIFGYSYHHWFGTTSVNLLKLYFA